MKIKFVPTGQEIDVNPNKTLLQLCTEAGIEIKSICKGVPSCAECRVNIASGEDNILPPGKAELSLIGTNYFIDSRRLSCQVRCFGDVTVDLTDQLARAESHTKKTRGYRAQKGLQTETHAKQGTMVLEEPTAPAPQQNQPREPRPPREGGQQRQGRGGGGQNQNRGGGKPQGGQQQQGKPQQNRNNQNRRPQNQGGGGKPQNQGQPKNSNQGQAVNPEPKKPTT